MKLTIVPFRGVGPIQFGMAREEVRKTMPERAEPFRKNMFSLTDTDDFKDHRIHVFYSAQDDTAEAIEIWQPAKPLLGGETLLDKPYAQLLKELQETDPDLEIENPGEVTSHRLGICVWAPTADSEPWRPASSVLAFAKTYWDGFAEQRADAVNTLLKRLGEQ